MQYLLLQISCQLIMEYGYSLFDTGLSLFVIPAYAGIQ